MENPVVGAPPEKGASLHTQIPQHHPSQSGYTVPHESNLKPSAHEGSLTYPKQ